MIPKIDHIKRAKDSVGSCGWCGRESTNLRQYGTRLNGQVYWSRPMCGKACHDEAHSS